MLANDENGKRRVFQTMIKGYIVVDENGRPMRATENGLLWKALHDVEIFPTRRKARAAIASTLRHQESELVGLTKHFNFPAEEYRVIACRCSKDSPT